MTFQTICMKCQILFSEKNKENIINLSSAENAQRVVMVKMHTWEKGAKERPKSTEYFLSTSEQQMHRSSCVVHQYSLLLHIYSIE